MKIKNGFVFILMGFLGGSAWAATHVISVNYVKVLGSDEEISTFGLDAESTASGWTNTLNGAIANIALDDGRSTAINISSVRPAGNGTANNVYYDNSPLHAWLVGGTGVDKEGHVTIENLNEVFPSGYKIIVYLNGHQQMTSSKIYLTVGGAGDWNTSDPHFHYKTLWGPQNYSGTPAITSATGSQAASLAQYAVFDALAADKVTLTIDTLLTQGGGGGIGGFQIIGDVAADYSFNANGPGEPALPAGAVLYNDFSNYIYKDYYESAGGTANPTYHNRKNGKHIGGSSKGVFVLAKRNPYVWNDVSTWFVDHSYAFKFADTNATNPKFIAPIDSTGGTALKIGYHGPRSSTGSVILNTGIKFDPSLNYTVTIRAKIKDEVDHTIISNAIGNVSMSAGFGNLAKVRNQYAAIDRNATNSLTTTNWTELSTHIYGGNLAQNAIFGEDAFANGFGPNGSNNRVPNNTFDLSTYYPQELIVSIGRSLNSTNTLDHSTWVDWIKIETNNYIAEIANNYGLSETNLLIDSDSDGQKDLMELATGGDPTNSFIKGVGMSIVSLTDVIRPIYTTNDIGALPNQNENGEVPVILSFPRTTFELANDAKFGSTNLVAALHRFEGYSWTNYEEYVVSDDDAMNGVIKWKETVEQIIDLTLSNYTFSVVTLNDNAHYQSNNIFDEVSISGYYTNSLDNEIDEILQLYTNEISVTKTGVLAVVGYRTNSVVRFKRPRSKKVNQLGCKYSVASRDNLSFGSWTNSGAYNYGDIYTPSNYPNTELGISTVPASGDTQFLQLRVTSPRNDPSTFYFNTFSETDYGPGDSGN